MTIKHLLLSVLFRKSKFHISTISRNFIINQLEEKDREQISKYGQLLAIVLRIILSGEQINIDSHRQLCKNTYLHLRTNFEWVSITPTLHKVLAHSWEVIQLNDGFGLKRIDESGLEGVNKLLRNIRERHSRKTSQRDCNADCLTRIWLGSDPLIQKERMLALPYCNYCKISGHGTRYCPTKKVIVIVCPCDEDDALFNSLLIQSNDEI